MPALALGALVFGVQLAQLQLGADRRAPSWGRDVPLAERWARRLEVVHRVMEADLDAARRRQDDTHHASDRRSPRHRKATERILDERGLDPTTVAFLYGWTTEGVRKLRSRKGLDPDTGEPRPRPLTAPARDQLAAVGHDGESG